MAQKNREDEINTILKQVADNTGITNYELNAETNVETGDGFVSEFYTGSVKNKNNNEMIHVAIKKAPTVIPAYGASLFKNENIFYRSIFPSLDKFQEEFCLKVFDNIPVYYGGSLEPEKLYICMENLKLKNYEMHDKMEYLNQAHLEYVFRTYGRFHALSFVFKSQNPESYEDGTKNIIDTFEEIVEGISGATKYGLTAMSNYFESQADKKLYEKTKTLTENITDYYRKALKYEGRHSCFTHGDCWSNNFLFKYSNTGEIEDIKLVDFQLCRDSTPIHDLSYFFYSGASKPDFDNLDYYLELYHKAFVECAKEFDCNGEELYPIKVLKEEWKTYSLLGILMAIMLWQIKLTDKKKCQEFTESENKEENWKSIMSKMLESDAYKKRVENIIRHAINNDII